MWESTGALAFHRIGTITREGKNKRDHVSLCFVLWILKKHLVLHSVLIVYFLLSPHLGVVGGSKAEVVCRPGPANLATCASIYVCFLSIVELFDCNHFKPVIFSRTTLSEWLTSKIGSSLRIFCSHIHVYKINWHIMNTM